MKSFKQQLEESKLIKKEFSIFKPKNILIKGVPKDFWVVVKGIGIEVFKTTYSGLMRQALGGLKDVDLLGVFKNEKDANNFKKQLSNKNN